jgi:superoxide dismutase
LPLNDHIQDVTVNYLLRKKHKGQPHACLMKLENMHIITRLLSTLGDVQPSHLKLAGPLEKGIPGLWSPEQAKLQLLLLDRHRDAYARATQGTDLQDRPLLSAMERCVRERTSPTHQQLLQLVGYLWSQEFFLKGLNFTSVSDTESVPMGVTSLLDEQFPSQGLHRIKTLFILHNDSIPQTAGGWLWLVRVNSGERKGRLAVTTTMAGWTPMSYVQSIGSSISSQATGFPIKSRIPQADAIRAGPSISQMLFGNSPGALSPTALPEGAPFGYYSPIVGISLFENAFLLDYGLDRRRYLESAWRAINWVRVSALLNLPSS